MILASQEPYDFPRIKSLIPLCREIGQTEIIGVTTQTDKAMREYDGTLFVERIFIDTSYLLSSKIRIGLFVTYRLIKRLLHKPRKIALGQTQKSYSLSRFPSMLAFWKVVTEVLYQRVRAAPIIPRLIICYGLNALAAGIRMKRLYGCPIIYEDQDSFFEVRSYFSKMFKKFVERRFLRFADLVIASSPLMAKELQGRYGISRVLTVEDGTIVEQYKKIIECFCNGES